MKTIAVCILLGFGFGLVVEKNPYSEIFLPIPVFVLGFLIGDLVHKAAEHNLGTNIMIVIACSLFAGILLSPLREPMVGINTVYGINRDRKFRLHLAPGDLPYGMSDARSDLARKRFAVFEKDFGQRSPGDIFRCLAPVPASVKTSLLIGDKGYGWQDVTAIEGDSIKTRPITVTSDQDALTIKKSDLIDWYYKVDSGWNGPFQQPSSEPETFKIAGEPDWILGFTSAVFVAGVIYQIKRVKLRNS